MLTCKVIFRMASIESLEVERKCTFPAACQWTAQFLGSEAFAITFGWTPFSNKRSVGYIVWLCIPTDADTK